MIAIHEPDVVLTDLGLSILGGYLGWRLATGGRPPLARAGAIVMAGLASGALWGAMFHAFFPAQTATPAGFAVWIGVALSIVVVAATLLWLCVALLFPRGDPSVRRVAVGAYAAAFAAVVLLVDESFSTIVRFYAPVLLLSIVAALWRGRRRLAAGFVLSAGAALAQQAGLALHPLYFDHNAVYHVVQGVALVVMYAGFREESHAEADPAR